jgi:ATP-dependent DNA helicase PIF1
MNLLPTPSVTYISTDVVEDFEDAANYTTEFLNSLDPPGATKHVLTLKVGSSVFIMRNIDPPKLCNGTRAVVTNLGRHLIQLALQGTGERIILPKIPLTLECNEIKFRRTQFPIKPCFSMTINKAQGQSLHTAGINLNHEPFSHGQLYVAVSRTGTSSNLHVCANDNTTKNVVYHKVLQDR